MDRPEHYNSARSWLAVTGASLALFATVGFSNAFGVFQEHYKTLLGRSDSDISWIGSVGVSFAMLFGPAVGIITDKYGPNGPLFVGSVGLLFSIFMTSLGTEYYQIFLSQGVLLGLSMALILNPTLAVVSSRVPHKRGMAFGLAIGGSSIGGIVWPIMLQELLYKREVGFGWTMRAAGFVMMLPLGIACFTIRNPPAQCTTSNKPPSQSCPKASEAPDEAEDKAEREKKVDFSILKKPAFLLLCLGLSCAYLGLLTPLFYLSSYAVTQGTAPATAFYLLAGLNAASFFGRVVPGILADRYGHFNLCATAALTSGIVAFCWTHATSSGGLIVLSLAYGFVSGGVMSLQSACAAKLASETSYGVALGCAMGTVSLTALVGAPISGQILAASGYLGLSVWAGATLVAASAILFAARLTAERKLMKPF